MRGRTTTFSTNNTLIGTDLDAGARFPTGTDGVRGRHAEIALHLEECCFYLHALEGPTFVNQKEVTEVILEAGDLIEFGVGGPKIRFHVQVEPGAVCKPVRQMIEDASDVGRTSGVFAFSASFVRDLLTHATLTLKIGFPIAVVAAVLAVSYFGGWLGQRRASKGDSSLYEEAIARLSEEQRRNREKFESALTASRRDVEDLRRQLAERTEVVDRLVRTNEALKKVLGEYSRGVCLVHGIWGLRRERSGRLEPMRDGQGEPVKFEYVGSGFLATAKGQIVTNRHVAQPWWRDPHASTAIQLGYEPYFLHLTVTFPSGRPSNVDPATIKVGSDERLDVATIMAPSAKAPVLPLYRSADFDRLRGDKVILLGYPTGMNALLAKADPDVLQKLQASSRNVTDLIEGLAAHGQISPTASQGAVNEIGAVQLIYDAVTMSGGSGGPVFGSDGSVIGVNAARLSDYTAANYGVRIDRVLPLLK